MKLSSNTKASLAIAIPCLLCFFFGYQLGQKTNTELQKLQKEKIILEIEIKQIEIDNIKRQKMGKKAVF